MNLETLIEISRRYGADPDYVLAGGGNTSLKDGDVIAVKASGALLGTIDENGFVQLSLSKLRALFDMALTSDSEAREKIVLEKLLEARLPGQTRRPSVETLLHALFPYRFVIHLHPALVNGMLCSRQALSAAETLFRNEASVLPYITPGYILADAVRRVFEHRTSSGMSPLKILFLQNHGVFVAADSVEEIEALYAHIFETLKAEVQPLPEEGLHGSPARKHEIPAADGETRTKASFEVTPPLVMRAFEEATSKFNVRFFFTSNSLIGHFLASPEAFVPLSSPFTPDHIVYAGAWPLFVNISEAQSSEHLISKIDEFRIRHQEMPKIIAVQNLGIFGLGQDESAAKRACELFGDAAKIAWYARSFGGVHPMQPADIEFIRSWEVEKYRASIAASSNPAS
ncbi:MAG: class II aldolase/adducin family protein [Rectinema subterraneum]|uniref:class II aldolase/adducin family protein n=1 Tax=Rectinema subterraneum TaxID=2653714 RepID=UPI003C79F56E